MINRVGILLFEDVELLDFAGPLQVFSSLQYLYPELISAVDTIGLTKDITVSKCLIKVSCNLTTEEADDYDLLLIPGGFGTRPIIKDNVTLALIDTMIKRSKIVTSVCTGSLILAKLGMLRNLTATTHHKALSLLSTIDPTITIDTASRYIDHGSLVISQGVSAGIDMSFYIIEKYFGPAIKKEVKDYIEYHPE